MADRWFDGTYFKREETFNHMHCDRNDRVFLHYILGLFSEIAGDESDSKGQNRAFFMDRGMLFFITRMSVRFHKAPCYNETAIFTTWYRAVEGRFFVREFEIRSTEAEPVASGRCTWALVDLLTFKTLDPSAYPGSTSNGISRVTDSPDCKKIVPEFPLEVLGTRPVYCTDLDCNNHVNNSVYTKTAVDFLPQEYQDMPVRDYVINFSRETKLGDRLEIRGGKTDNGYIIQGLCDGTQQFASEFVF